MLSHSPTLHSTPGHYILCRSTTVNPPVSIKIPLRKPQLLPQIVKHIQITPINTTTRKKKTSNLDIIRLMDTLNHPIPLDIYSSFLRECTLHSDSIEALQLHNGLIRHKDLRFDSPLIHRLLYMLVSCGQLDIARNLFDKMPLRKDILSWAIVIIGYLDCSKHEEGINLFIKMLLYHNVCDVICKFPNWGILLIGILEACLQSLNLGLGKQLHGLMLKLGATNDFSLSFSLMDFYGKLGYLKDANFVFNQVGDHNTDIWTVKIVNTCKLGCFDEVIEDFKEMGRAGIRMNGVTFSSVLRACGGPGWYGGNCGKEVHAMAIKLGLESDALVKRGLIDMYGKCGMVMDAKRVFELNTNKKNAVYWNALLMAYVRNGMHIDAIKFLYLMEASRVNINEKLINHVRIACS
ncbi:pentatricopeptide repeat-containing protein At1g31790 [Euphorbia lathyris]|uniref:pentatricopeptide repeat-containing protein At1g31790 n=1 Tax=Euphorbia lathyris TaxID=212925 RepID=UPI00331398E3